MASTVVADAAVVEAVEAGVTAADKEDEVPAEGVAVGAGGFEGGRCDPVEEGRLAGTLIKLEIGGGSSGGG